ncbi:MAG TPA: anti-sigma factor [Gemmatimonadales bacterium]|nr:anti-sigma factor [Gemmatimonadales bacterium]
MNAHEWYVENRAGFVARALEEDEERTFRDHLPRCEECRREVARLEQDLGWLPMGAAPAPPPPGLTHRIVSGVLRQRTPPRSLFPWAAAAAILVAAGGWSWQLRADRDQLRSRLAEREHRLLAVEDTLSVLRQARQVTQTSISMDGRQGGLVIFQDPVTHRWGVVVHGLPPAPPGSVYQFWFVTSTGMVRSVEVPAQDDRPAFLTVAMPGVAAPVMGAALTVEPMVNRSGEPRGPELAHVMF